MLIVDAQVHIWGANTPERPWPIGRTEPHRPQPFSKDDLLKVVTFVFSLGGLIVWYEGGQAILGGKDGMTLGSLMAENMMTGMLLVFWLARSSLIEEATKQFSCSSAAIISTIPSRRKSSKVIFPSRIPFTCAFVKRIF